MTKGQKTARQFVDDFLTGDADTFSWQELSNAVKESGAVVRNWLTIRETLQWFISEGFITRTDNLHVEEYCYAG